MMPCDSLKKQRSKANLSTAMFTMKSGRCIMRKVGETCHQELKERGMSLKQLKGKIVDDVKKTQSEV